MGNFHACGTEFACEYDDDGDRVLAWNEGIRSRSSNDRKDPPSDDPAYIWWFANTVKLPQYYYMFVNNGFEGFQALMEGNPDDQLLRDMGIEKIGHRKRFLFQIRALIEDEKGSNHDVWCLYHTISFPENP